MKPMTLSQYLNTQDEQFEINGHRMTAFYMPGQGWLLFGEDDNIFSNKAFNNKKEAIKYAEKELGGKYDSKKVKYL